MSHIICNQPSLTPLITDDILEMLGVRRIDSGFACMSVEPTVKLWGTGRSRREFLHVDDLADACLFLMRAVILAGGLGARISEEVHFKPYPMNNGCLKPIPPPIGMLAPECLVCA